MLSLLGLMDVKLMKAANLTPKDMVLHLALTQEYIWTRLTPGEDKKVRARGRERGTEGRRILFIAFEWQFEWQVLM